MHMPASGSRQAGNSRVMRTCLKEHAPTPLAANGLDMRVGHPATYGPGNIIRSQTRFSSLGTTLSVAQP